MAAVTDKLRRGAPNFSTTLAADKGAGAASATLSNSTNVPTDTAVDFTVGRVDSTGAKTPATKAVYKATLSGVTISNLTLVEGTDQLHKAGTIVEITFTAATWNDMVTWGLVQHNQDGTHGAITATSVAVSGTSVFTGAVTLPSNTVTTTKISNASVTPDKLATGTTNVSVATSESTSSTTYTNLTTTTDTVTITVGANGIADVSIFASLAQNTVNSYILASVDISGATTIAATDNNSIGFGGLPATAELLMGATFTFTGLTPGSTTFKMKYRVSGGTGTFKNRRISVKPL